MTYKEEFITFMVRSGVLTFGDFTTKSGRKTPYFVNTGNYKTGAQAAKLGDYYAACIQENMPDGITCLFGPAYKGIPLAVSAAASLYRSYDRDLPIREHYRLLSVLKNLVTNAVEAIQAGPGHGNVQVDCRVQGDDLRLQVTDNGPGISSRAMNLLFQVGYSTKFNPDTGDINRGVGLPAVKYIVDELGGSIQVDSRPGVRTQFDILLPLAAVTGGQA